MTRLAPLLAAALFAAAAAAAPTPRPVGPPAPPPGRILVLLADGSLREFDPDGKRPPRAVAFHRADPPAYEARLSPDGRRVAFLVRGKAGRHAAEFRVRPADAGPDVPSAPLHTARHVAHWFFAPDGKVLYGSGLDLEAANNPNAARHECWANWAVDLGTRAVTPVAAGGEYRIIGTDAAGKRFATARTFALRPVGGGVFTPRVETHWTDRATLEHRAALPAEADVMPVAPFPDGTRWLVKRDATKQGLDRYAVYRDGAATGAGFEDVPRGTVRHIALSPDGGRLCYALRDDRGRSRVMVSAADGRGPQPLVESDHAVLSLDWPPAPRQ